VDWLPKDQVDKFTLGHVDMLPFGQHGQVQPLDKVDILTLGSVTMLTIDNVGNFPLIQTQLMTLPAGANGQTNQVMKGVTS